MTMHVPKKYFHDRLVLLLLTVDVFVVALMSVLILLRLDSGDSNSFIIEYRSNLGLSGYEAGGATDFIAFIAFGVIILVSHIALSMRMYDVRRQYSVGILAMGTILVTFSLVVSNALLAIR